MTAAEPLAETVGVPAELRQDRIAEEVETRGFARVTDLADRFGVSVVTVRSDLGSLESLGRVRRVRGGAVPAGALRHEPPLEQAAREHEAQKAAIAKEAAAKLRAVDAGEATPAAAPAAPAAKAPRKPPAPKAATPKAAAAPEAKPAKAPRARKSEDKPARPPDRTISTTARPR